MELVMSQAVAGCANDLANWSVYNLKELILMCVCYWFLWLLELFVFLMCLVLFLLLSWCISWIYCIEEGGSGRKDCLSWISLVVFGMNLDTPSHDSDWWFWLDLWDGVVYLWIIVVGSMLCSGVDPLLLSFSLFFVWVSNLDMSFGIPVSVV